MDYALEMLREQRESESKARAQDIVARVRALNVAQYEDGTMVCVVKKFSGDTAYTYVAVKARGGWYRTGSNPGPQSNEQFEEFIASKLGFETFDVLEPVKPKAATIARQPRVRR